MEVEPSEIPLSERPSLRPWERPVLLLIGAGQAETDIDLTDDAGFLNS